MKRPAAIGIDFGISRVHANLISLEDGELFAESERTYLWDVLESGRGEIDPDKIWRCAQESLAGLLARAQIDSLDILTLSFSCFGDVFVAVDETGDPVYPMLQCSDRRAEEVFDDLRAELSESFGPAGRPLVASVGTALGAAVGLDDLHRLVAEADEAMYADKTARRSSDPR